MDDLLIHPVTKAQIAAFTSRPSGSVLITGPAGSGKTALSLALAAKLLDVVPANINKHPYFIHIIKPEDKSEIPIDSIRQLISDLKLKVPVDAESAVNRAVYIEDSHLLSDESQNAMLKLLEEPPAATVFILSVTDERKILPTVASRMQKVAVLAPGLEASARFFDDIPQNQLESAWRLSRGAPGLLNAIINDSEHPLKSAVAAAKSFLAQDSYGRMITLKKFGGKESLGTFLDAMSRVLAALQSESIKKGAGGQNKLVAARKLIDKLITYHENNVNSRLISLVLANELRL